MLRGWSLEMLRVWSLETLRVWSLEMLRVWDLEMFRVWGLEFEGSQVGSIRSVVREQIWHMLGWSCELFFAFDWGTPFRHWKLALSELLKVRYLFTGSNHRPDRLVCYVGALNLQSATINHQQAPGSADTFY